MTSAGLLRINERLGPLKILRIAAGILSTP
jgi:hypothetical protein